MNEKTVLYQLTETSEFMMSFVLVTKNDNVIVVDGGRPEDMPLLKEYIGGRHIAAWILTHAHIDHIFGNKFFQDTYDCKILSTEKEKPFISEPSLESTFYYAGIDTDKSRNPFFLAEPSAADTLTYENLPEGFEIINLPGHSFDMIGVRTPDNVIFLADSILSEKTWTEHRAPFFHDVNSSIITLGKIKELEADVFIPSHNEPLTDIRALADYNISKLTELKETVYSLCDRKGFDELFTDFAEALSVTVRIEKYVNYSIMLRNILQALVEDEKIKFVADGKKFVYIRV